jgi:hypothetical protein
MLVVLFNRLTCYSVLLICCLIVYSYSENVCEEIVTGVYVEVFPDVSTTYIFAYTFENVFPTYISKILFVEVNLYVSSSKLKVI